MKTITQIATKGIRTKLSLAFFVVLTVGSGFLLLYANDLLALTLNNYLMTQNFDGFAQRVLLTAGMFALVFAMNGLGSYLCADFEWGAITRWPLYYIERLLRAKQGYFTNRPAAELFANLWTASQASGSFYGNVLTQMLATQPEIMLIDEAFSNMDEELETKIITDLFREYPNRTIICISHRNSTKPLFDEVVTW
ncbi:MAG: hypothetical protein FWD97_07750 [Defluviitaleaceae bacterium]|nr:hypothetical protein [Defluviitaleaceae bacterium]